MSSSDFGIQELHRPLNFIKHALIIFMQHSGLFVICFYLFIVIETQQTKTLSIPITCFRNQCEFLQTEKYSRVSHLVISLLTAALYTSSMAAVSSLPLTHHCTHCCPQTQDKYSQQWLPWSLLLEECDTKKVSWPIPQNTEEIEGGVTERNIYK